MHYLSNNTRTSYFITVANGNPHLVFHRDRSDELQFECDRGTIARASPGRCRTSSQLALCRSRVKKRPKVHLAISAIGPKRTWTSALHMSAFGAKRTLLKCRIEAGARPRLKPRNEKGLRVAMEPLSVTNDTDVSLSGCERDIGRQANYSYSKGLVVNYQHDS